MKRYKQFDHLIVEDFAGDEWPHPRHNHNHFEIAFIVHGKGIHHLNGVESNYQGGDLFLLGPEDIHEFFVREKTRFIYFKFTKLYLTETADESTPEDWNRHIDQLLYQPERKKGNLLHNDNDRERVGEMMELISQEFREKRSLHLNIIFQLFTAVTLIIKRNAQAFEMADSKYRENEGIAREMLEYIDSNIYNPHKLTLQSLAEEFHYSPNYVGTFFKEHVGLPLSEYVTEYRLKLIQQRLRHSQIRMKQIAREFGFVDESHLNKFIKRNLGESPTGIRDAGEG